MSINEAWRVALVAALLLTCCHGAKLRLAVLPDQDSTGQAAHKTGRHDLIAYARGLEKLGHTVTIINKLSEEDALALLASGLAPKDALFDAILSQGEASVDRQQSHGLCLRTTERLSMMIDEHGSCMVLGPFQFVLLQDPSRTWSLDHDHDTTGGSGRAVADFAARLQIPVVRFVADSSISPGDAPRAFFERPAALVFASNEDMEAFGDQMEETSRLVISPSRLNESILVLYTPVYIFSFVNLGSFTIAGMSFVLDLTFSSVSAQY